MTRPHTPGFTPAGSGRAGSRRSAGKSTLKRRRASLGVRPAIEGISKNSFKKLARRAGELPAGGQACKLLLHDCRAAAAAPLATGPQYDPCLLALLPAGVARISGACYDPNQGIPKALMDFLLRVLPKVVTLAEHARRFTITPNDVAYALKQMGM
jgi:histone H3/H4